MIRKIFVITLGLLLSEFSFATTYFVDNDRPDDSGSGLNWSEAKKTISATVSVSSSGDTILVRYGEYPLSESILVNSDRMITSDMGSNNSWDSAVYDSSACVLTADTTRILTIVSSNVSKSTIIRGFKITQGLARYDSIEANYGGGICVADSADPVIEHCWITDNLATNFDDGWGGGIAILGGNSEPVIQYCTIDSNLATNNHHGRGGGIYIDGSATPQIHHNKIYYNQATTASAGWGGGIYCNYTNAEIFSNDIQFNVGCASGSSSAGSGGGICIIEGNVQIYSNKINNNIAANANGGNGGGILINSIGNIGYINDNIISYNIASTSGEGGGGGLHISGDGIVTTFNTISYNTASTNSTGSGGGAVVDGIFQNNTVTHNKASVNGTGKGGGIHFNVGSDISKNIISHNIASENADGYGGGGWAYNAGNSILANNIFYNNANQSTNTGTGHGSGFYYWKGGPNFSPKNNIFYSHNLPGSDSTAIFSDVAKSIYNNCFYENGIDYNANIISHNEVLANPQFIEAAAGNFEIQYNSPCIDAGADTLIYDEVENHDMGWVVDIGIHEYMESKVMKAINGAGEYWFGGQVRAKVNVTDPGSLSELEIKVHANELHPQAHASVQRWYEIIPTGTGATFDVTLSYKDTEINDQNEYELNLWRWDDSDWYGPGIASDSSTIENWLTVLGQTEFSDWVISDANSAGALPVKTESQIANNYQLFQNYPNPFNPVTTIEYQVSNICEVDISIYNMLGQKVATLVSEQKPAGFHKVKWYASNLSSGIYYYRLTTDNGFSQTRKMMVLK